MIYFFWFVGVLVRVLKLIVVEDKVSVNVR